jgi:transcriptional regulator with XRE-family HTH domain
VESAGVPTLTSDRLAALAAAVRVIRAGKQLTQEEVADRGRLDRKTPGRVERGDYSPTFTVLVSIADGLDVPLSELVRVYEAQMSDDDGPVSV